MKPILISHFIYQDFVLEQLRMHYSGSIFVIVNSDWPIITKFWMTDLSCLTTLLQDFYDPKGPSPRDPASMFRSFFLFLMTNPEIGITKWVDEMKRKSKIKKGKKGQKAPTTTSGKIKRLVDWMIRHTNTKTSHPSDRLFDFFQSQILSVSASLGLLGDINSLSVAGDGTPVETSVCPRSKSTCNCRAQGITDCKHPRIYSQPDCNLLLGTMLLV